MDVCPQGTVAYIVRYGDTLETIAGMFRVPVNSILAFNPQLNSRDYLYLNETLCVPARPQPPPIAVPYH